MIKAFKLPNAIASILLILGFSAASYAHGVHSSHSGLFEGFIHPLSGLDHILAMFAVGLWASQKSIKMVWSAPLIFASFMFLGMCLGVTQAFVPMIEIGIALSVLIMGLLIAINYELSALVSYALVGCFAIFHGHAHGTELSFGTTLASYVVGFLSSTIMLHLFGILCGMASNHLSAHRLLRSSGFAISALGTILLGRILF